MNDNPTPETPETSAPPSPPPTPEEREARVETDVCEAGKAVARKELLRVTTRSALVALTSGVGLVVLFWQAIEGALWWREHSGWWAWSGTVYMTGLTVLVLYLTVGMLIDAAHAGRRASTTRREREEGTYAGPVCQACGGPHNTPQVSDAPAWSVVFAPRRVLARATVTPLVPLAACGLAGVYDWDGLLAFAAAAAMFLSDDVSAYYCHRADQQKLVLRLFLRAGDPT